MGNSCACECLREPEQNHQIQVKSNTTYTKDYTQPGNIKGGNQFLLLDSFEDQENNNFEKSARLEYQEETPNPEKQYENGNQENNIRKQDTVDTLKSDGEGNLTILIIIFLNEINKLQ